METAQIETPVVEAAAHSAEGTEILQQNISQNLEQYGLSPEGHGVDPVPKDLPEDWRSDGGRFPITDLEKNVTEAIFGKTAPVSDNKGFLAALKDKMNKVAKRYGSNE